MLQGDRLIIDEDFAGKPKGRDGVGNRIVKAPVENAKLDRRDVLIPFAGQLGDGLAHIPILVDDLVDAIAETEQFSTVYPRDAPDLRNSLRILWLDSLSGRGLLETKGFDELLEE